MKTGLSLLLAFCLSGAAVGQGIDFHHGDLASLFATAAAEKKPVYVDVYTAWCGPCKRMAREVFPDSAVGAFMNPHFVSYKVDAEKGEGIVFAKKHKVSGYPTSLFFSPEGEMVYQDMGYGGDKSAYLTVAQTALDEIASPENLLTLRKRYAAGSRDTTLLYKYLAKLQKLGINGYEARDVAAATLAALPQNRRDEQHLLPLALANQEGGVEVYTATLPLIERIKMEAGELDNDKNAQLQSAMLGANGSLLPAAAKAGKPALQKRLAERRLIMRGAPGRDARSLAQDEAFMRLNLAKDHKQYQALNPEVPAFVKRYWLSQTQDSFKVQNAAVVKENTAALRRMYDAQQMPKPKQDSLLAAFAAQNFAADGLARDLNTFAWAYHQMKRPAPELELALTWADRAVALQPQNPNILDTKAHLQQSLGQRAGAIKTQKQAIALATAAGEDAESFKTYLAELEKPAITAKAGK